MACTSLRRLRSSAEQLPRSRLVSVYGVGRGRYISQWLMTRYFDSLLLVLGLAGYPRRKPSFSGKLSFLEKVKFAHGESLHFQNCQSASISLSCFATATGKLTGEAAEFGGFMSLSCDSVDLASVCPVA